ncbi:CcmD family protein [Effusibacillus lacus]|uniref:CcmD family protein n=1 Tax=Effusibacillus lacus TaxID=1348429 RepID=A0A292YR41_9BACL|nr:CcmD family protein [Effusibacillus lacus]TCS76107.1 CcmD family protein [Effusibacillus lacus]GAX91381.1 hypothetical protein EFBL_3050 [Effusibacillus lacus]
MEYLAAAYTVIWVLLAGYLLLQGNRQKKLQQELKMLTEMVGEGRDLN